MGGHGNRFDTPNIMRDASVFFFSRLLSLVAFDTNTTSHGARSAEEEPLTFFYCYIIDTHKKKEKAWRVYAGQNGPHAFIYQSMNNMYLSLSFCAIER